MPAPSRAPDSPARRALRTMLIQVFALHVVAIAVHELADVAQRPGAVRATYLAAWMLLTLAIVATGLYRIRVARSAARAAARDAARGAR